MDVSRWMYPPQISMILDIGLGHNSVSPPDTPTAWRATRSRSITEDLGDTKSIVVSWVQWLVISIATSLLGYQGGLKPLPAPPCGLEVFSGMDSG
ncbi:hypothetical protein RRG08_019467 [Elysia crispata]|uniref:Uncharacterized protein n=1 Tax=Elysia crispata TaxID=231223 RepID=A0AAE1A4H6_9GAST|nr:hypothetical protein RRG08_019467 [Elysia crispata]